MPTKRLLEADSDDEDSLPRRRFNQTWSGPFPLTPEELAGWRKGTPAFQVYTQRMAALAMADPDGPGPRDLPETPPHCPPRLPFRLQALAWPLDALPMDDRRTLLEKHARFQGMDPAQGETAKYTSWFDTVQRLPLGNNMALPVSFDKDGPAAVANFLTEARATLDNALLGQVGVKERVMEIVAHMLVNPQGHGHCIGLHGPCGVGKTAILLDGLGAVLKRPVVLVSVGGMTDAAALAGHGFTYEGSKHGALAQGLIQSRCMNPILLLDEVDKASQQVHHLLVHATDATQNHVFQDAYLGGISLNLSKALFVFTMNDTTQVCKVLMDRMTLVEMPAYAPEEKIQIAKVKLWPRLKACYALPDTTPDPDWSALLVNGEGGVRGLKRRLEAVAAKANLRRLSAH